MKFKYTWITLIVLISLGFIIVANLGARNHLPKYVFSRDFKESKPSFKLIKGNVKVNNGKYTNVVPSDSCIISMDINYEVNKPSFMLYLSDLNLNLKETLALNIPQYSNILFVTNEVILYTNSNKFFVYDIIKKTSSVLESEGLRVSSLIRLSDSNFLMFGERKNNHRFEAGFFNLNLKRNLEILPVKILEVNQLTRASVNGLRYSGAFTKSVDKDHILYYCKKYSGIFLFDKNGKFFKDFHTKDHAPLPEIITSKNGTSYYKRGKTFTGTNAVIMEDNYIKVFSTRSAEKDDIVIDSYSTKNYSYLFSQKLHFDGKNCTDITSVTAFKDKIIISFDTSLASFNMSR
ncbi:hypothetical protein SAMN05421820_101770 [Pedobacter steynii]|uniref:TolB-like 6-blade propeller-like n=1 Tax=Pedobacter steynii TaxID=430522 RepID=A0A1G9L4J6_9SPHI|nr:hypothetical protein [Pedobacter steynii]NQX38738.1 hypothetical protein [Pedobacter steynii]SDL56938.1 hypothetical protein SAMN05421820_101770 [Pedobacter steynii]